MIEEKQTEMSHKKWKTTNGGKKKKEKKRLAQWSVNKWAGKERYISCPSIYEMSSAAIVYIFTQCGPRTEKIQNSSVSTAP